MIARGGSINNDLARIIEQAAEEFDKLVDDRMRTGEKEYGTLKFLEVHTMNEAIEELADLVNWARFTGAKAIMLRDTLRHLQAQATADGPDGFIPTSRLYGHE